jgi:DNA primase
MNSPTWHDLSLTVDWFSFYQAEQGEFPFRQDGSDWKVAGLCPMHADNKPGSFKINVTSGHFTCHSCGAHGNPVAFVMQKYGVNVKDAIRHIRESGA